MNRICALVLMLLGSALQSAAFAQSADIPEDWFYDGSKRPSELKSLEGKAAPELDAAAWIGDAVKLSDLRGKVVVVDFWATWCGPCMAAIPENVEMVEELKGKPFAFVGVHDSQNGWSQASKVVKDNKINYPVAKDSGSSAKSYKLQFWPTYIVIDHKGIVRAAGLIPSNVKSVVEILLKEVPATTALAGNGNPDEWYVSPAERRPSWLLEAEGKPLPSMSNVGWIGNPMNDEMLKGKITVLSLLGAGGDLSVSHCRELQNAFAKYSSGGVRFVGLYRIGTDSGGVKDMFEREKFEFRTAIDIPAVASESIDPAKWHGSVAAALGVRFWPMILITDRTGRVRVAGAHPKRISLVLDALLAEPAPGEASQTVDSEKSEGKESK